MAKLELWLTIVTKNPVEKKITRLKKKTNESKTAEWKNKGSNYLKKLGKVRK